MVVVAVLFTILGLPALFYSSYLFVLALLSARRPPPPYGEPTFRFDFVVPAHNEEAGVAATVQSLLSVDYPRDRFRVLVVADNCTDATAAQAEQAGATVLIRTNDELRGKGYALKLAFDRSLADGLADAVVVIDADTIVSSNLLRAFAARLARGASAAQAEYGVRNPNASWRTRLMVIALAAFHGVRSLGREALGVSSGLRGNGMMFTREVVERVPHEAFSLVEDLEYGIRLVRAGYVVRYVDDAQVFGEMVSTGKASQSQRRRWEQGRAVMAKLHGWPLFREGLARGSKVLLDTSMDVLVPPLTTLVVAVVSGSTAALALALASRGTLWFASVPWLASLAMIAVYVARGLVLSGTGVRGLLDLAWAPAYMFWKLVVSISPAPRRAKGEWIRTAREREKP